MYIDLSLSLCIQRKASKTESVYIKKIIKKKCTRLKKKSYPTVYIYSMDL